MTQLLELRTEYDSRRTFYGKARVELKDNGDKILWSYTTAVAEIINGVPKLLGKWSMTTTRHQKEFIKQFAYEYDFKQLQKEVL